VFGALVVERVIIGDVIDIDGVVMRPTSQVLATRRVLDDFTPLLCFLERLDLLVQVVSLTDSHFAHVVRDCDVIVLSAVADGSTHLVGRVG